MSEGVDGKKQGVEESTERVTARIMNAMSNTATRNSAVGAVNPATPLDGKTKRHETGEQKEEQRQGGRPRID